jgi:hypothetical protein
MDFIYLLIYEVVKIEKPEFKTSPLLNDETTLKKGHLKQN